MNSNESCLIRSDTVKVSGSLILFIIYYYHTERYLTEKGKLKNNSPNNFYRCTVRLDTKKNWLKYAEDLKKSDPAALITLKDLGFENSDPEKLSAELNRAKENFITVESIPEFIRNSISSAWLGKIDGKFYSVIMPSRVDDEDVFRSIAKDDSNIFFVGKMTDISRDLDYLTKMVLKFFSVAYILIFVVLKFFYSWKQTFKIISIPLLIISILFNT